MHLLLVPSLKLISGLLVPGDLVDAVGLVVVPGDNDGAKQGFLSVSVEAGPSPSLLMNLPDLLKNSVFAKDLVADLAAQQNLLLVLPDRGHVARPDLQLVLLEDDCSLRV